VIANQTFEWRAASVALGLALAGLIALGWLQSRPQAGAEVAAIFPPWTTQQAAFFSVLEAGGLVVRQGIADTVLVVHGEEPRLIDRLYAAGAWVVVDPRAFGGCLIGRPRGTA
jgi:hypothetical protein